jgi:hypothetical protein
MEIPLKKFSCLVIISNTQYVPPDSQLDKYQLPLPSRHAFSTIARRMLLVQRLPHFSALSAMFIVDVEAESWIFSYNSSSNRTVDFPEFLHAVTKSSTSRTDSRNPSW